MATAYTSLLGLALPVTGELSGTWGDTVNNSITSLLDTAVAGTTTLSTDADVTLTTTTGASNQSRQAILLCSGSRSAQRTITAPAQSKIYVVINNTTGGFAVKVVGVGPTTGVTIANGKTSVIAWNGTDFVEISPASATNLSGGAAGSLPYQTGANTTTFLSIGTSNHVLTSSGTAPTWTANTGTGNVVRATSPTLTTPTLGVASATSVALGLGAVGTPALTFTGDLDTGIWSPSANNISISTGGVERTRITSAGLHQFNGNVIAGSGTSGDISINGSAGTGACTFSILGGGAGNPGWDIGTFSAPNTLTIGYTVSASRTERVRIDSAGNVGIGTNNPTSPLTVYAQNNQAALRVTNGPSANNVGITLESLGGNVVLNNGNGPFELSVGGSVRAVVATSGNVGIGLSSPAELLHIQSASDVAARVTKNGVDSVLVGANNQAYISSSGPFNVRVGGNTSASNKITVSTAGDVILTNSNGFGFGPGSGGTVTQTTSRTTGVTINKPSGAITLVSAAGSTAFQSFTVTNAYVQPTDTVIVSQKSGTDLYRIYVTNVGTQTFQITFATTGGTTTEQPVFNFNVIRGSTS